MPHSWPSQAQEEPLRGRSHVDHASMLRDVPWNMPFPVPQHMPRLVPWHMPYPVLWLLHPRTVSAMSSRMITHTRVLTDAYSLLEHKRWHKSSASHTHTETKALWACLLQHTGTRYMAVQHKAYLLQHTGTRCMAVQHRGIHATAYRY